ncbi:hypothetical protein BDW59DRAFT_167761 [Aspergillus cavernicola]|uniref:STEEP1 domain-containing protein n=1 Tax=Aspergillus cavernicola TaxID=176166 RepID=A0ABR4HB19_9EURO
MSSTTSQPQPQHQPDSQPQSQPPKRKIPPPQTLPITTHHCRYCTNLLLATTRDLSTLPRRQKEVLDSSTILPLRTTRIAEDSSPDADAKNPSKYTRHYTILLSSAVRERKPTIVRCPGGFEKRWNMLCGRCRLVMGYFVDPAAFVVGEKRGEAAAAAVEDEEGGDDEGVIDDVAVFLLPGALAETEIMSDEEKMRRVDKEWSAWFKQ